MGKHGQSRSTLMKVGLPPSCHENDWRKHASNARSVCDKQWWLLDDVFDDVVNADKKC